jgi:hypothetical protein
MYACDALATILLLAATNRKGTLALRSISSRLRGVPLARRDCPAVVRMFFGIGRSGEK